MNILGMGLVCSRGRGIPAFQGALAATWQPPAPTEPAAGLPAIPVYRVSAEALQDKAVLAKLRRADRFSRMAALAAWDAISDAAIEVADPTRLGIILATAFGPHATTFRFLDDILQFGDAAVSPTTFSHSVHTAAASYIASLLNIRGPAATLTDFHFSFQQSLLLADMWIKEGICDHVLLGAADECGPAMEYIFSRMMKPPADGAIRPFTFQPGLAVPGEGSAFFVLGHDTASRSHAEISEITRGIVGDSMPPSAVRIIDAAGLLPNEEEYRKVAVDAGAIYSCSSLFGSIPSGSAFSFAAAALMIRNQVRYPCPVPDNPHRLPLADPSDRSPVDSVCCARINCYNHASFVYLRKPERQE